MPNGPDRLSDRSDGLSTPRGLGRVALFIDGANLHATARTLGFEIDYRKLLREFSARGTLFRAFYYTAVLEDQEYSSLRPLVDWLDYNGYAVVTKPAKEFTDHQGRRRVKGNMDMELAIDALEHAAYLDHMVLFSGDGDFRPLVQAVQRRGVRVSVVSSLATQPAMVSDELRRQADDFIELAALQSRIGRDPAERAQRNQAGPAYYAGSRVPPPAPQSPGFAGQTPGFMAASQPDEDD